MISYNYAMLPAHLPLAWPGILMHFHLFPVLSRHTSSFIRQCTCISYSVIRIRPKSDRLLYL